VRAKPVLHVVLGYRRNAGCGELGSQAGSLTVVPRRTMAPGPTTAIFMANRLHRGAKARNAHAWKAALLFDRSELGACERRR
jgi:hypothetical protein